VLCRCIYLDELGIQLAERAPVLDVCHVEELGYNKWITEEINCAITTIDNDHDQIWNWTGIARPPVEASLLPTSASLSILGKM
jgi:hypothetical protein